MKELPRKLTLAALVALSVIGAQAQQPGGMGFGPGGQQGMNPPQGNQMMERGRGLKPQDKKDDAEGKKKSKRADKVKKIDTPQNGTVYMFAASFSLMDTVLYISEIQEMKDEVLMGGCFLVNRAEYSSQFSHYAEGIGAEMQTGTVFFDKKWKKALKQYHKVYKKAEEKHGFKIVSIGSDFKFAKPAEPSEESLAIPDMLD